MDVVILVFFYILGIGRYATDITEIPEMAEISLSLVVMWLLNCEKKTFEYNLSSS